MSYLRAAYKLPLFIIVILSFFPVSIVTWYTVPRQKFLSYAINITNRYAKVFLKLMAFKVKVHGDVQHIKPGNLIVCNHMSYMDVMVISSINPSCFITSTEIKNTPFLGWLCRLGGCVFVERRSRTGLDKEIKEITDALKMGLNVVLYPEATSTDGVCLKKFKRPLFRSARLAGTEVVPLSLNYVTISGKPWSTQINDLICWYGDMPFFSHLVKLLMQSEVTVHLYVGKPLVASEHDERQLAVKSQQIIYENYTPALIAPM